MDFKKQLYRICGIAVVLLIVGVVAFFVLQKQVEKNVAAAIEKDVSIKQKNSSVEILASLQKDSETAKNYSPILDKMLINKDQILDFRKAMIDMAKRNNIDITMTFDKETKLGNLTLTPFTISIIGRSGVEGLRSFLEAVETSTYFVKVQSVDIGQAGMDINGRLSGSVASF